MNNLQILELGSVETANNSIELIQMSQAWHDLAMQLGWFCLIVGFIIGVTAGYWYSRRKYGSFE
jgi:ABC-type xylose transport system permease subunit